jgi:hypothetical protein
MLAALPLLVSGCSTKPLVMPLPLPPVPESSLIRCPDLPYRIKEGTVVEGYVTLVAVAGRYYECQSMLDDLIQIVRNRQKIVDNP